MGKNDTGENKSERLHMLISPSEIEAIDEWGFKNRIRSKAEAVRRLCQIGLAFDAQAEQVEERSRTALDELLQAADYLLKLNAYSEIDENGKRAFATLLVLLENQIEFRKELAKLMVGKYAMSNDATEVEEASEVAAELRSRIDRMSAT